MIQAELDPRELFGDICLSCGESLSSTTGRGVCARCRETCCLECLKRGNGWCEDCVTQVAQELRSQMRRAVTFRDPFLIISGGEVRIKLGPRAKEYLKYRREKQNAEP